MQEGEKKEKTGCEPAGFPKLPELGPGGGEAVKTGSPTVDETTGLGPRGESPEHSRDGRDLGREWATR